MRALGSAWESPGLSLLAIWVYGSVARGKDTARSDLDVVAVAPADAPANSKAILESLLEAKQTLEDLETHAQWVECELN